MLKTFIVRLLIIALNVSLNIKLSFGKAQNESRRDGMLLKLDFHHHAFFHLLHRAAKIPTTKVNNPDNFISPCKPLTHFKMEYL